MNILKRYTHLKSRGFKLKDIACYWLRENRYIWNDWVPEDNLNKTKLYLGGIFPISGIYFNQTGIMTGMLHFLYAL